LNFSQLETFETRMFKSNRSRINLAALLSIIWLLITKQTSAQLNRCDFLCQNDDNCRSGRCVMTQCVDTISCYRFCFQCGEEEKCYETGDYCYYLRAFNSANANKTKSRFIGAVLVFLFAARLTGFISKWKTCFFYMY